MQDLNDKINNGGATAQGQLSADEWNELPSEVQNVIESVGQTLSGGDLTQLVKAIVSYSANGNFFADSGIANAYVLTAIGAKQGLYAYGDGSRVAFIPSFDGTGAATINVSTLGVKDIRLSDGSALLGGEIKAGEIVELVYDLANNYFVLLRLLTDTVYKELKRNIQNLFINGDFSFWQRGLTKAAGVSGFSADRWRIPFAHETTIVSDAPAPLTYGIKVTGDSGNPPVIRQPVELANLAQGGIFSVGKKFTVSGYVKAASQVQTVQIATIWSEDSGSLINFNIDNAATPVYTTATFDADYEYFEHTFEVQDPVYVTSTSYCIDISTTVANGVVSFTGLQLVEGSVAPPFQVPNVALEFIKCQRFYQVVRTALSFHTSAILTWVWNNTYATEMRDVPSAIVTNTSGVFSASLITESEIAFQRTSAGVGNHINRGFAALDAEA